ncbi:FTR1 family iron permease [Alteromonas sp. ALT199]|uniref:hypothetical protein n=1 Tax=unclassified Alteromonas TaxID=2614992 RepID=UPI0004510063|nr:hypothetical protein [Alteromonas sp. ALT199]MBT3133702.1 FTR1 family iron permease [Alteromonas sp. ALT199]
MLINTVVLFLRDTLPIFLLISVLLALPRVSTLAISWRVLLLVLLAVFTYTQLGLVSQLSEGAGFEYLKSILFFIAWFGMCFIALLPSRLSNRFSLGLTLLVIGIGLPNSLHFLVYFVSEISRNGDSTLLLLGTIIGLGISISIAILLNILLTHFISMRATYFFATTFVAAQTASIALLLEQTDTFPSPRQLWDSSEIISDNSEYGHLLNSLMGYEATPSASYLLVFFFALVVPNLITFFSSKKRVSDEIQEVAR